MIRIERFSDGNDADSKFWDERWKGWDAQTIDAAVVWEGMLPTMRRWFPRGARLLEAGCGTGKYCIALRQQGYRMTGLDNSRTGLDVLQRIAPAIPAACGSVLQMPFSDGEFDGALSLGVVEHFEEGPAAALAELARVVRPGGRLFLTVPLENWLWDLWQRRRAVSDSLPPRRADEPVAAAPPLAQAAQGGSARAREKVFYQYLHRRDEIGAQLARAGFRARGVKYFGRRTGLENYLAGLSTVLDSSTQAAPPPAASELRGGLKRRFPRLMRAARLAERTLVETALPGPVCAHTVCFLAVRG